MTFLRPGNRKVLAYLREHDDDVMLCVFNLSRSAQAVELDLSGQKGKVPVEMTGASAFPPIGTLPYLLTLPAYGFYWFTLADPARLPSSPEQAPESLPELETLVLGEGWNIVESQRGDRERVDRFIYELLPTYIARQRWFGPKDATIVSATPERIGELPQTGRESFLLVAANVALEDGSAQRYFLPLALTWGEEDLRHDSPLMPYLLAKIRRGSKSGIVFDAAQGETFPTAVLHAMMEHRTLPAAEGELRFEASDALRALDLGEEPGVRLVGTGDPAHTSRTLGDRVNLKIARRLRRGMDPGIEMGRFLTKAGYANSPPYLGAIEHVDGTGVPTALAAAFEHVRNQGDAWTVVVDALDRELEDESLSGHGNGPGLPYSLSLIETIGRRTGELHRALAGADPGDPDFAPEPVTDADLEEWCARALARAEQAFTHLQNLPATADEEARDLATRLLALREAMLKRIDTLAPRIARGNKLRLHNDYHLAKILVAANDIYIVDFEGEPDQPVDERRQKAPPSRDIATMLRSFDYAARTAVDRQRQRGASQLDQIESRGLNWRSQAERRFLRAYGMARDDSASGSHLAGGELLPLFLADKLFYEIVYEGVNRPLLLAIPLRAALELVEPMDNLAEEEDD
jgi:maltose alpha-D-glucosyltransferase/alpha-amylase